MSLAEPSRPVEGVFGMVDSLDKGGPTPPASVG